MKLDNQALVLKVAAMLVAAPRYVGLMLFLSGFVFEGLLLDALHIAEGVAGLSLAVLEGFALAYILSRRQLGFSSFDKKILLIVVSILLLLLPIVATPYLLYLFDGSKLFVAEQNNVVLNIFKFLWAAATASMPILIIVGVALVEKDPIDVQLLNAEREALLKQRLAEIEAETEQKVLHFKLLAQQAKTEHKTKVQQVEKEAEQTINRDFVCDYCGSAFETQKGLAGHTGHCKVKQNGNGKVTAGMTQ